MKKNIMKHFIALLLLACFNTCLAENTTPEYSATLLWDSKYVSEGRDNLGDGGLTSIELSSAWNSITAGVWYADGTDTSYDEINLFIEYGFQVASADAYVALTRLEFPDDDESDNEISTGVAWGLFESAEFAVDYVYSTEANGGFLDLSIGWDWGINHERLTLGSFVAESIDFGYASDGHDGENNLQIGLTGEWALNETFGLVGTVTHSWAQKDVDLDGLGDETWLSLGITTSF